MRLFSTPFRALCQLLQFRIWARLEFNRSSFCCSSVTTRFPVSLHSLERRRVGDSVCFFPLFLTVLELHIGGWCLASFLFSFSMWFFCQRASVRGFFSNEKNSFSFWLSKWMQARLGSRSQLQLLDFQLRQIFCYSYCGKRKIRVIAFCNPNWSSRLCFSEISSIDAEVPPAPPPLETVPRTLPPLFGERSARLSCFSKLQMHAPEGRSSPNIFMHWYSFLAFWGKERERE